MVIFRCDGTYEGILTAVFSGYRSDDVMIECDNDNMFVFGECTEVVTDLSKSLRVAKGIRKISYEAEYMMYLAALNNNPDRGTDIFYFVKSVFQNGARGISDYHESNGVKEEYIGQFLGACSHYIDKLDKLRLHVNKMVKNREYQELYSMTRSCEQKEHELGELYANFDKVFLNLFPNFVEDLNSLLKPEAQIHLTDATKLPAMVRVFALIRLGIDDSTKIAEFLHYAVNTIYNYRAKLRNGAIGERNEFEKNVKELGTIKGKE